MKKKSIKVGLLGFGTVGGGTYRMLTTNADTISYTTGVSIEVAKILVRDLSKKRDVSAPDELFTDNPDDILKNPEIDVVVEVLGGLHPAFDYMEEAIKAGKHVVTANKAVIAKDGPYLTQLAQDNKVVLRYEASVGGGIPILNALSTSLTANEFTEVAGIVNGTTNYILTQMAENDMDYADALKQAQAMGFAEADPTGDVEGYDAVNKLTILISTAFGLRVAPEDIPREGITNITKDDMISAKQFGYTIKLLAQAKRYRNTLECSVQPAMVPLDHPLATVKNEYNAIFARGNAVDDVMLYGKGAGAMPTGSAVVGNLLEIARAYAFGITDKSIPTAVNDNVNLQFDGEGQNMYYVTMLAEDMTGVLGKIASSFGDAGIAIKTFVQKPSTKATGRYVPLVYILGDTTRERLNEALEEISTFTFVKEIKSVICVADLDN